MRFSCWCIEDVCPLACAGTNTRGRRRSDVCRKSVIRAVTVDVSCWSVTPGQGSAEVVERATSERPLVPDKFDAASVRRSLIPFAMLLYNFIYGMTVVEKRIWPDAFTQGLLLRFT